MFRKLIRVCLMIFIQFLKNYSFTFNKEGIFDNIIRVHISHEEIGIKFLTVCSTLMGPRVHLAPEPSSFGEQVWWFPRVFLSTWMDLWFTFVPFRSNLKGSKLGPSKLNTKIRPYHKIFLNSPFFRQFHSALPNVKSSKSFTFDHKTHKRMEKKH